MSLDKHFKRILIISNPASTNAQRVKSRVNQLKRIFPDIPMTTLETSPKCKEANRRIIVKNKKLLGPDTLFCISAGDGTVNLVIETILSAEELTEDMRKTTILPLWGGNANDLAHMLNGYPWRWTLYSVFRTGKTVAVNPLQVTLKYKGKSTVRRAACYASFGAIAFAANRINMPAHRQKSLLWVPGIRTMLELHTVGKALRDVPAFSIEENNRIRTLYEYALINGSRMAKIERLPIRLTDNAFYMATVTHKHPAVLLYVLRILRRQRFGRITNHTRKFKVLQSTWLQIDGEVVDVKAGTEVAIELSRRPFYAVSKRLRVLQ